MSTRVFNSDRVPDHSLCLLIDALASEGDEYQHKAFNLRHDPHISSEREQDLLGLLEEPVADDVLSDQKELGKELRLRLADYIKSKVKREAVFSQQLNEGNLDRSALSAPIAMRHVLSLYTLYRHIPSLRQSTASVASRLFGTMPSAEIERDQQMDTLLGDLATRRSTVELLIAESDSSLASYPRHPIWLTPADHLNDCRAGEDWIPLRVILGLGLNHLLQKNSWMLILKFEWDGERYRPTSLDDASECFLPSPDQWPAQKGGFAVDLNAIDDTGQPAAEFIGKRIGLQNATFEPDKDCFLLDITNVPDLMAVKREHFKALGRMVADRPESLAWVESVSAFFAQEL